MWWVVLTPPLSDSAACTTLDAYASFDQCQLKIINCVVVGCVPNASTRHSLLDVVCTEIVDLVTRVLILGNCAVFAFIASELSIIMIDKGFVSERSHAENLDSLVCTCRSHTVCPGICGVGMFSLFWLGRRIDRWSHDSSNQFTG